jgi:hypothetical protein
VDELTGWDSGEVVDWSYFRQEQAGHVESVLVWTCLKRDLQDSGIGYAALLSARMRAHLDEDASELESLCERLTAYREPHLN